MEAMTCGVSLPPLASLGVLNFSSTIWKGSPVKQLDFEFVWDKGILRDNVMYYRIKLSMCGCSRSSPFSWLLYRENARSPSKLPGLLKTKESGSKLKKLRGWHNKELRDKESEQDRLPRLDESVWERARREVFTSQLLTTGSLEKGSNERKIILVSSKHEERTPFFFYIFSCI